MKLKIFLVFFSLLTINMVSQNTRIEGTVKDSTGVAIEMANVIVLNKTTNTMEGYAITDSKGHFSVTVKINNNYTLKATYLGFQSFEKEINVLDKNIILPIILKEGIQLDLVEIVREMPVTISGDTISYKADAFKNGTERKLEDVLKKLPGVEVNKDGEIEIEGKKVQKVMIEGKDFFDGDTKIATKNIPADALDKIQVLRNYNEVLNLKGLGNDEENVAINIKLKEGKKNFWFGDVNAGIGINDDKMRTIINPKLFYYSPKYSINIITNWNDIGEMPLTAQDYFKFTGGFKNVMKKGGTGFNITSNDLGILGLQNNQAAKIETTFGAGNFSYNPSKALTISGFGIFMGSKTNLLTNTTSNRTDNLPDGTTQNITETAQENTLQNSKQIIAKLSSSYVPSEKLHLDYDILAKYSNQTEKNTSYSSLLSDIYTEKEQNPFSINQNLNYYYTLNNKNVFALELQHLYQEEDPFYKANLENQPFLLNGYNESQNRNIINQNRFTKTNKVDAKFDYYYTLNAKSNINLTLGNTYSYQNFNSSIFQTLDNGSQNNLTAAENNNTVNYQFNDVFLGMHYRLLLGKVIITPGFSFHKYHMNEEQLNSQNKVSFTRFLPGINALWQIKKAETLSYDYELTNNFTDINKLAEGYVFSNYNSLFRGNRNLENATSQVHSIRYFKYNMFNYENIFANLSYTKQIEAIKNKTLLTGVNQTSTAVNINSNFPEETISGAINYGRSFSKYYKANLGIRVNWNKFNNIRVYSDSDTNPENDPTEIQTTESVSQQYTVGFSTTFKKLPNLGFTYNYSVNDNFSDTIFTDSPTVNLEYFFLNAFSFVADYSLYHNYNKSKTIDSEYDFLSASIIYQKKQSKWEWKLSATNILNTKSLNTNSFSQLGGTSSFSAYTVQSRIVLLSLKYNL
jgi:hypothetical protein